MQALFGEKRLKSTAEISQMVANSYLIKPYGFEMNDKRLRRAGLDYKDLASVYEYDNFDDYLDKANPSKLYLVSSKVSKNYTDIKYHNNDSFLFGSETKGLPKEIFDEYEGITVPMQDGSRSLNLSNCVSIVAYEAWRQLDFAI